MIQQQRRRDARISAASFVWVRGPRGPECQRWPADAPAGVKTGQRIIASRPLSNAEAKLSLTELAAKYPAPRDADSQ
jgi:hypothetical protein